MISDAIGMMEHMNYVTKGILKFDRIPYHRYQWWAQIHD